MRLVALEGQSPNVMGALTSGIQAGRADRNDREARQVGQLAASGDMDAARKAALSTGNPDIINTIGQMDAQQRAAVKEHQDQVARLAYAVKNAPPEEKQQALAWALGEASKFMPPEEIKKNLPQNINDPGVVDQWADRIIAQASSLDQLFERADKERMYGLKERDFNANESYRNRSLSLEERRLNVAEGKSGTATLQTIYDDQGRETKAMVRPDGTIERTVGGSKAPGKTGVMSPAVQKQEDDDIDMINTAQSLQADLSSLQGMIERGDFKLGPVSEAGYKAAQATGTGGKETAAYNTFTATVNKVVNDSLRLNKGVQTEGDAIRARNELFTALGKHDTATVLKRLKELETINARAVSLTQKKVDLRRSRNNAEAMDWGSYGTAGSALEDGAPAAAANPAGGGSATFKYDANGNRIP